MIFQKQKIHDALTEEIFLNDKSKIQMDVHLKKEWEKCVKFSHFS